MCFEASIETTKLINLQEY